MIEWTSGREEEEEVKSRSEGEKRTNRGEVGGGETANTRSAVQRRTREEKQRREGWP